MSYLVLCIVLIILTFVVIYYNISADNMAQIVEIIACNFMRKMLEEVCQKMITNGQRWKFDTYHKEFTLAELFSCRVSAIDPIFVGASDFVTNNVSFDVASSTVNFDIFIPKLYLGIGHAYANAMMQAFGMDFEAEIKGWVTLMEPRVTGSVAIGINDESKLTATGINFSIKLKEIQSKIQLKALETDYSETVNNFLQAQLPDLINTYINSFKAVIEQGLLSMANPILAEML